MRFEPDPWLARFLDRDVYRVSWAAAPSPDLVAETIAATRSRSAFYYTKISTERVDQVRTLCGAGFAVVDVQITFERAPDDQPGRQTRPGLLVRDARATDHGDVLDIA